MTLYLHECKRGLKSFLIWSLSLGLLAVICLMLYPEMKDQSAQLNDMFSGLGSFTSAFGMDVLGFADAMGFYGIECGACLGLGGGLYAAFLGSGMISKEESGHTAEFLYTNPLSRTQILLQKYAALITQLIGFNLVWALFSLGSFAYIGEEPAWKAFLLFQFAQFVLQLELATFSFLFSAFLGRSSLGAGIGLMAAMYFLSMWGNISDSVDGVQFITPYWYADASRVIADAQIDGKLMLLGVLYLVIALLITIVGYNRKDITA